MEKRRLGRTNHESTIVTFGAYSIGKLSQDQADTAVQMCLDEGINHLDIAPGYANSMERIAPWMPDLKTKMFIGSKTPKRTRDEAWKNIEEIMDRMKTDSFDLFQLHGVLDFETLDQVTAKGGALDALIELKEQGITKWIGITGHGPLAPEVFIESLQRYDFDTVMFPVNSIIYQNQNYRSSSENLISLCNEKDVGIQGIKMIARGGWGNSKKDCGTWYDPHRDQESIDKAIWWQLSQPIHTAPSCGEFSLLRKVLDAGSRFKLLDQIEQEFVVSTLNSSTPEPKLGILN